MLYLSLWCTLPWTVVYCVSLSIEAVTIESEGKVGILKGSVTIGGLVPIHQPLKYGNCSTKFGDSHGVQRLEAMIYAVKKVQDFEILLLHR